MKTRNPHPYVRRVCRFVPDLPCTFSVVKINQMNVNLLQFVDCFKNSFLQTFEVMFHFSRFFLEKAIEASSSFAKDKNETLLREVCIVALLLNY